MNFASSFRSLVLLGLLVACSETPQVSESGSEDDGGRYTVSAQKDVTLSATEGVAAQALGAQALSTPALRLELRNYQTASTGARSRGVVSVAWPDGVPLNGTVRVGLETVEGELVASYGVAQVTGGGTLNTPYVYQPSERLCVTLDAVLQADSPSGDAVRLSLQQRVCEEAAQSIRQDVLLASRTVDKAGVRTTAELRHLEGVGYRALIRYEAPGSASALGKLCLHDEGKASCKRSSSTAATFVGGGVAEFVTGYYAAPPDLPLCASVPVVGACATGGVELLKAHSYNGGVTTNVVLLETPDGVVGRATFSVPEGVSLRSYAYLDFVHGGDYESFFSLYNGAGVSKGVPSLTGPATQTVELGPLPPGAQLCYSLGVPYSRVGEYPELIVMRGCVEVVTD